MGKFQELALSRQELSKEARTPFFLYADEFQNFITPSLESLLTGARKYGLGLTLAHQTLAQLSSLPKVESALFGNAHTRIVFRVGEADARKLSEGFSFFEAGDIARLGRGEAIMRLGTAENDFNLATFPAPRFEDNEVEATREAVVASSRGRYGTPVEELKAALGRQYGVPETRAEETRDTVSERPDRAPARTGVPPAEVQPPQEPKTPSESETVFRRKPTPEPSSPGRGGTEHKYLQHLTKRLAEERGFRAALEEQAGDGRTDVVLRKESVSVAVEISITTDTDHEIENVRKCLGAGFTHVLFVSPVAKRRKAVAKEFADAVPPVTVCAPEEIVSALDALDPGTIPTETTVRGYKVKVTRQTMSPEEVASRDRKSVV